MRQSYCNCKETWINIFDDVFSVSSKGSVMRISGGERNRKSIVFKTNLSHHGYPRLLLRFGSKSKSKSFFVHKLVANAFFGNQPENMQVNHKDGNKTNNCICNLEYVTPSENVRHARDTGLTSIGDKHYTKISPERIPRGSILNKGHLVESDIVEIRRLRSNGGSTSEIAKLFKVTPATISKITLFQTWTHV